MKMENWWQTLMILECKICKARSIFVDFCCLWFREINGIAIESIKYKLKRNGKMKSLQLICQQSLSSPRIKRLNGQITAHKMDRTYSVHFAMKAPLTSWEPCGKREEPSMHPLSSSSGFSCQEFEEAHKDRRPKTCMRSGFWFDSSLQGSLNGIWWSSERECWSRNVLCRPQRRLSKKLHSL